MCGWTRATRGYPNPIQSGQTSNPKCAALRNGFSVCPNMGAGAKYAQGYTLWLYGAGIGSVRLADVGKILKAAMWTCASHI